jgi:hypothetical protein
MANRGIQRILINLNGDSSLINTKIMNYINNSGLIKKKLGQPQGQLACTSTNLTGPEVNDHVSLQ